MKNSIIGISVAFLIITISSCRKTIADSGPRYTTPVINFNQVFDLFWNNINNYYVYWDTDTTDWNAVYHKYHPLFAQLDYNSKTDLQKSVAYFRQMTYSLKDGHFQIVFNKPELSGTIIFPAAQHKQLDSSYHYPYNYYTIDTHYFDSGYISVSDRITDPTTTPLSVTLATIHNNIIYFSCNHFSLLNSYQAVNNNHVKPVLDSLFNLLSNPSFPIKGVIVDVRNNPGGNLSDLSFLAGRFIEQPLQLGFSQYKSGTGRLDFTPWITAFITPQPNAKSVKCPVIALTDNFTVSMAEDVAMAIHAIPNGLTLGETTWGATGPLISNEVYNDGQFIIPGFLTVYTSSAKFKYINGKMYEGVGFPPDVPVPFNEQALNAGYDRQLEKAIQLVQ